MQFLFVLLVGLLVGQGLVWGSFALGLAAVLPPLLWLLLCFFYGFAGMTLTFWVAETFFNGGF